MFCYQKDLLQVPILLKVTVAEIKKKKEKAIKKFLLQVKTKITKQNDIYNEIKKIHSYDCFEFAIYELNSINIELIH